jgi:excisionase family DNA binding protein
MKRSVPVFYTISEVADALGLSIKTVRRRVESGEIRTHRFGRSLRISDDDFRAYVASQRK